MQHRIRVAVNGYGVIGKRVAAAMRVQDDMCLTGVCDVVTDWRARTVLRQGFRLFGATPDAVSAMRDAGLDVSGTLDDRGEKHSVTGHSFVGESNYASAKRPVSSRVTPPRWFAR